MIWYGWISTAKGWLKVTTAATRALAQTRLAAVASRRKVPSRFTGVTAGGPPSWTPPAKPPGQKHRQARGGMRGNNEGIVSGPKIK